MKTDNKIDSKVIQYDPFESVATIKVFGVGGGGCNAVNRMIEEGVQGVEFWVVNTDSQVISASKARNRIVLGKDVTKGLGAGANPEKGREASIESEDEIKKAVKGADMVFIAAGMGGGTGTGAAPTVARLAKDTGALTIGIVTKPFTFEGKTRFDNAELGLGELKSYVDSLIVISNDKLLEVIGTIPLKEAFQEADKILRQGVQTITDLIAVPSLINLDFADVKATMEQKGYALIGIGAAKGENKAEEAAKKAIASPLLEASIVGAKDAIVNITGGQGMTLFDANDAVDIIKNTASNDVNIIFGVAVNDALEDEVIVTVIATGFDESAIIYPNYDNIYAERQKRKELINSPRNKKQFNKSSYKPQQSPWASRSSQQQNQNWTRPMNVYSKQEPQFDAQDNHDVESDDADDDIPSFLRR
ncbi:cell division protein FtsZ [Mycoplasma sp. SG1]|uniref:cell division protein FtsZ n=1 Tax=Mycoplasma sp. SG1 TaxID=2810348 RepID=UPI0020255502|nr:cell division protein FtsZ [Mycoplasma sp. SG1]URM53182.1 cell division protein FtsZ [Mycoplasma sp. SG1]